MFTVTKSAARDLLVREPVRRQLGDPPLRRRQLAGRPRPPRTDPGKLGAGLLGPAGGAELVEGGRGLLERVSRRAPLLPPPLRTAEARAASAPGRSEDRARRTRPPPPPAPPPPPRRRRRREQHERVAPLRASRAPRDAPAARRARAGGRSPPAPRPARPARRAPRRARARPGRHPARPRPPARVRSQTAPQALGRPLRLVREQRGDPPRPQRLVHLPPQTAGLAARDRRRRPPLAPRPEGRGPPRASARDRS